MSATGFASALDLVWTPGDQRHSARLHWQSQWHTINDRQSVNGRVKCVPLALPVLWTLCGLQMIKDTQHGSTGRASGTQSPFPDIRPASATPPGFARDPKEPSRSAVMSICPSSLINRDSFPRPAPFHGLKDNQRGHSIHVAQFNARHDGA